MNQITSEMVEQNPEKAIQCTEKHLNAFDLDKSNPLMNNFDLMPKDPIGSRIHFFCIEIFMGKNMLMVAMAPEEINNEEFEERKKRSDKVVNWFSEIVVQHGYKALMVQMIRSGLMWIISENQKESIIKFKE